LGIARDGARYSRVATLEVGRFGLWNLIHRQEFKEGNNREEPNAGPGGAKERRQVLGVKSPCVKGWNKVELEGV